jgi:CheY-like chemotaxis protein
MYKGRQEDIRVLLADDNEDFLKTAVQFIESEKESHITVVKAASDGYEAIGYTTELKPDIVLLDINMPKLNGFMATEVIKKMEKPPAVILFSIFTSDIYHENAKKAGADFFLGKMDFGNKIIPLIKELINKKQNN